MAIDPRKTGYTISGISHVLALAIGLATFSRSEPVNLDSGDAIPVEIITDAPQAPQGATTARQAQKQPVKIVDRQSDETKETDDEDSPVEKEVVKKATPLPPPPPKREAPSPDGEPAPSPAQRLAVAPPPMPKPQPDKPEPKPEPAKAPEPKPKPAEQKAADLEREQMEEKLAELAAQEKREEQKKLAEAKAKADARAKAEREAKEKAEREQAAKEHAEARAKAEAEAKAKAEADAKAEAQAKALAEAKAKAAREAAAKAAQDRANARAFDPAAIAARVNAQNVANDTRKAARTEATGQQAPSRTASLGRPASAAQQLSASERDAMIAQIQKCFNPPVGVTDPSKLKVRLEFRLAEDGSVSGRPVVTSSSNDAAAGAAVRAVMNCGPYKLPANKYDAWKEVAINFDPSDMRR